MTPPRAFVLVLLVDLHFPDCASLKAKRSELNPVRAYMESRLGASVAEVAHQDQWQRATLVATLAAGSAGHLEGQADRLEGWLGARFPQGARVQRQLASWHDLAG